MRRPPLRFSGGSFARSAMSRARISPSSIATPRIRFDRLPALVDDLIRLKVDVIVTAASNETQAAKKATGTIPIVGLNLGDPVARGFVASYARPGGNITGFASITTLSGKRLEVLKDAVPKLTRVAVLWQPQSSSSTAWSEHEIPARALTLQLHSMEVSSKEHFEAAFKAATKAGSEALSVALSALINSHQKQIAELAVKYRLPAIYPRREFVDSGGLMSYGADRDGAFQARRGDGRQDSQRHQTRRHSRRAADQVRVRDKSQSRQADRTDDPTRRVGAGEYDHSIGVR